VSKKHDASRSKGAPGDCRTSHPNPILARMREGAAFVSEKSCPFTKLILPGAGVGAGGGGGAYCTGC